jgi:hypothetical protein
LLILAVNKSQSTEKGIKLLHKDAFLGDAVINYGFE